MTQKFEAQIKQLPTASLTPYGNNVKQHPDSQVQKIIASIAEFGFTVPIVVDADGVVIAGHGRLAAAQKMQLKQVPCIVRDDLSPAQAKALRIADNRIADEGLWDEQALMAELESLSSLDYDLTLTGFDEEDLAIFSEDEDEGTEYQPPQRFGGSGVGGAARQERDEAEEGEPGGQPEEPEQPKPPVGDRYPLAIVLSSGEFKEWKELKERLGERQDKSAFLKLMRGSDEPRL